jgi:AcrR family transcriptional regulator
MGRAKANDAKGRPRGPEGLPARRGPTSEICGVGDGTPDKAPVGRPARGVPAAVKVAARKSMSPAVKPARKTLAPAAKPSRADKSAFRRDAILAAALEEFSARGFAAARLDDVAARAGVGKGTIYLHFRDKQALFQELVTTMLVPFIANLETPPPAGLPIRIVLERLIDLFVREVYGTERRKLIRLIMTEGPRFPQLAEFHYHHVVKRALAAMRALLEGALRRGELRNDALVRFPQLVIAPAMMAIVWSGLFDRFAALDVAALMRAHLDLIFGTGEAS